MATDSEDQLVPALVPEQDVDNSGWGLLGLATRVVEVIVGAGDSEYHNERVAAAEAKLSEVEEMRGDDNHDTEAVYHIITEALANTDAGQPYYEVRARLFHVLGDVCLELAMSAAAKTSVEAVVDGWINKAQEAYQSSMDSHYTKEAYTAYAESLTVSAHMMIDTHEATRHAFHPSTPPSNDPVNHINATDNNGSGSNADIDDSSSSRNRRPSSAEMALEAANRALASMTGCSQPQKQLEAEARRARASSYLQMSQGADDKEDLGRLQDALKDLDHIDELNRTSTIDSKLRYAIRARIQCITEPSAQSRTKSIHASSWCGEGGDQAASDNMVVYAGKAGEEEHVWPHTPTRNHTLWQMLKGGFWWGVHGDASGHADHGLTSASGASTTASTPHTTTHKGDYHVTMDKLAPYKHLSIVHEKTADGGGGHGDHDDNDDPYYDLVNAMGAVTALGHAREMLRGGDKEGAMRLTDDAIKALGASRKYSQLVHPATALKSFIWCPSARPQPQPANDTITNAHDDAAAGGHQGAQLEDEAVLLGPSD